MAMAMRSSSRLCGVITDQSALIVIGWVCVLGPVRVVRQRTVRVSAPAGDGAGSGRTNGSGTAHQRLERSFEVPCDINSVRRAAILDSVSWHDPAVGRRGTVSSSGQ